MCAGRHWWASQCAAGRALWRPGPDLTLGYTQSEVEQYADTCMTARSGGSP